MPNQGLNGVVAAEGGGGELVERGLQGESRLGFFFSRPTSVWEEKFFVTARTCFRSFFRRNISFLHLIRSHYDLRATPGAMHAQKLGATNRKYRPNHHRKKEC